MWASPNDVMLRINDVAAVPQMREGEASLLPPSECVICNIFAPWLPQAPPYPRRYALRNSTNENQP